MSHYKLYPGDTTESMPAPVPTKPLLASYSQTDPQWADMDFSPGCTFRRYGCLICSYAMIASQLYYESAQPPTFARKLRDVGAINGAWVAKPARMPEAYPSLSWGGAIHWRNEAADIGLLQGELRNHGATVVELAYNPAKRVVYQNIMGKTIWNTHYVVLVELTGEDDGMIIDPIDGVTKSLRLSRYARTTAWGASRIMTGCRLLRVVKAGG